MGDTGRSEEINLLNHCQMKNTEHGFTCVADFLRWLAVIIIIIAFLKRLYKTGMGLATSLFFGTKISAIWSATLRKRSLKNGNITEIQLQFNN